jgi:SprB repeat
MKRFTTKILSFAMVMAAFCQSIQAQTCVTITEPAVLSVTASATAINCNAEKSTITAVGAGGSGSYQYNINSGAYQVGATFANISAGTHTIGIKDMTCLTTATVSVTITQPAALSVSIVATENSCVANDNQVTTGSIFNMTASATGGTPAGAAPLYTYAWSNTLGSTASVAPTVAATTTYTVTATDANSCTATASVTATVIAGPTVSITGLAAAYCKDITAITLAGTATPASGTFKVDGTVATTLDPSAVALTAGSHTVLYTYTDGNGCTASATQAVVINELPTFTLASTNVKCNGAADGTITITVTGGLAPYIYSKDNGDAGTYQTPTPANATTYEFTGLAPRLYKPTVKDANNCVLKCQ